MMRFIALAIWPALAMLLCGCESRQPAGVGMYSQSESPPGPPAPPTPPPPPPVPPAADSADSESAAAFTAAGAAPSSANSREQAPRQESRASAVPPPAPEATPSQPPAKRPPSSPSNQAPKPGKQVVRLSAGLALPQLLPEGTQVGVSVDYKLTGQLNSSSKYVLVIQTKETSLGMPVTLASKGTLQGFLPYAVRPEHRPFRARIEEHPPGASPLTVSNVEALQTSY